MSAGSEEVLREEGGTREKSRAILNGMHRKGKQGVPKRVRREKRGHALARGLKRCTLRSYRRLIDRRSQREVRHGRENAPTCTEMSSLLHQWQIRIVTFRCPTYRDCQFIEHFLTE